MGRIPARFERVAAAFDADVARNVRLSESSSSDDHSEHSGTDLSDLVKSFIERGREGEEAVGGGFLGLDSEKREILEGIFCDDDSGNAKEKITRQVELAWGLIGEKDNSSPQFKPHLMSRLRERGFDAGLCKCKWDKNTRFPAGDYQYIDVYYAGNRYIVEISLVAQFEIARPTNQYSSLVDVFPLIFVGKMEELRQVVSLMCTAIKVSMKSMDMYIPPWRRIGYMQAKWFSSYKRIIDENIETKRTSSVLSTTRSIQFVARPVKSYNCRDHYGSKPASRVCHLTTAFYADSPGMLL